jgi:hypothetical protein
LKQVHPGFDGEMPSLDARGEVSMEPTAVVAAASAIAMASGLNVYATVLALGLMGRTGVIALPESLTLLEHPAVLGAAGVVYVVEFLADRCRA